MTTTPALARLAIVSDLIKQLTREGQPIPQALREEHDALVQVTAAARAPVHHP